MGHFRRHHYVARSLAFVLLVSLAAPAADLKAVLRGVEDRYNKVRTLRVEFAETLQQGRRQQSESGVLSLRKPGRMRWDYAQPQGKLFLSDGKQVYLYLPATNRVEKQPLKESDDMRAPLAFLLGKLDFDREFKDFQLTPQGANSRITAVAKNDRVPYERVEFTTGPQHQILQLSVHGRDGSELSFRFQNETMNPPLDPKLFTFQIPPNAELVDLTAGVGQER